MIQIIQPDESGKRSVFSLDEACRNLLLEPQFIVACVEYDVAPVNGGGPAEWNFTVPDLLRIHKAYR